MKFLILLVLWTLCIISPAALVHEGNYYGSIIKNVYEKYRSAGVIIALASSDRDLERGTLWYETTRMLSNGGISTLILDFKQFESRLNEYIGKTYPSLIVIDLNVIDELHSLESITKNLDMSYSVWLIFFSQHNNYDICNFCRNPPSNFMNLNFGSKALILCCDSEIIEEWWCTEKHCPKRQALAQLMNGNLYISWFHDKWLRDRRNSMDGQRLRVAVEMEQQATDSTGRVDGITSEVLKSMSKALNFTVSEILWERGYGSWNRTASKWTGLIGRIQRNEADLALGAFSMTNERLDIMRFTTPTYWGVYQLHFRRLAAVRLFWDAYFKVFRWDVWMAIICLILISAMMLVVIGYNVTNFHIFSSVCENCFRVWSIYCQQGLSEFPSQLHLRIFFLSLTISAFVISTMYSALLLSILAVSSTSAPFSSLEEFAADGTYKLIVVKDTVYYGMFKRSTQAVEKKMMALMKAERLLPRTHEEAFKQICTQRLALYTHEIAKLKYQNSIPCETISIRAGKMETTTMAVPRNSVYIEHINNYILNYMPRGGLRELLTKYYAAPTDYEDAYQPVNFPGISPLLVILGIGSLIAFVTFIIESYFHPPAKREDNGNENFSPFKWPRTKKGKHRGAIISSLLKTKKYFSKKTFHFEFEHQNHIK
ncbi:probable glutamate receptor [Fopius arisanus]|uniref:Probable glutamate receptor n=1 Tax=Fopius arisanus TaxID=64838 RepID=A0A9R1TM31_9HYME|nr:PREDICTED: probable glutamate receptor [Fopius arisanus]